MNAYQQLGTASIILLIVAVALTIFAMTGRHSKRTVYLVSGTVLVLMITVSVLCSIIYREYGI
ncbi:MAG TPA: hypothetical protein VI895_06790 [Bdellovibrionota bacterium]|nr:hypothetical protein [Bdellovibrionota bacterium]